MPSFTDAACVLASARLDVTELAQSGSPPSSTDPSRCLIVPEQGRPSWLARDGQHPLLAVIFCGSIGAYCEAGGRAGGQRTRSPRRCSTIVPARTSAPQRSKMPAATQESEEASFFSTVLVARTMPPPRRMTAVAYHKPRTHLGQGRRPWVAGCSTSGTALNYPTCRAKTPWDADGQQLPHGRELRLRPHARLPPPSPHQANPRLDRHLQPARHPHLDHPRKPQPHHHPRPVLRMRLTAS
jgi:hypothetical protein